MKTAQRHQLKTNEVAEQLARASGWLSGHGNHVAWITGGIVLVGIVAAGIWTWRQGTEERAGGALAEAMIIVQAQIVPPGSGQMPQPNTYSSEERRAEAALKEFREVIDQYPSSSAATTARFEAASLLTLLGKSEEAEKYFREVETADEGIHAQMARMAVAELQVRSGKYDEAITTYRDLAARKDEDLPVDGVLMQLGRAYELAGKRAEALQTYERVVSEFPNSIYVSSAREAADGLKGGTAS